MSVARVAGAGESAGRIVAQQPSVRGAASAWIQRMGVGAALGWASMAVGGVLLLVGYLQVSGTNVVSDQLAYLAGTVSGGVFFMALGLVATITHHYRRLAYGLGTGEAAANFASVDSAAVGDRMVAAAGLVRLGDSASYHREDCTLVAGRDDVAAVTTASAKREGLRQCQLCEP